MDNKTKKIVKTEKKNLTKGERAEEFKSFINKLHLDAKELSKLKKGLRSMDKVVLRKHADRLGFQNYLTRGTASGVDETVLDFLVIFAASL